MEKPRIVLLVRLIYITELTVLAKQLVILMNIMTQALLIATNVQPIASLVMMDYHVIHVKLDSFYTPIVILLNVQMIPILIRVELKLPAMTVTHLVQLVQDRLLMIVHHVIIQPITSKLMEVASKLVNLINLD
jgi:hypothetical protein